MDKFYLLPLELKQYIFTFLPGEDLWTCLGVCTEWRKLANNNKQWKNICYLEHIDPEKDVCCFEEDESKILCSFALLWKKSAQTFKTWRTNGFKKYTLPVITSNAIICQKIFTFTNKMAVVSRKNKYSADGGDYIDIYTFSKETCVIDNIRSALKPHAVAINNDYVVMSSKNLVIVYKKDPDYKIHLGLAFCNDSKMHVITNKIVEYSGFEFETDPSVTIEVLSSKYLWLSCTNSISDFVQDSLYVVDLETFNLLCIKTVMRLMFATKSHVVLSTMSDIQVFTFKGDLLLKLNVEGRCKATDDFIVTIPSPELPITIWAMNGSKLYELPIPVMFELDPVRNLLYECSQSGKENCKLSAIALQTGDSVWNAEMQKSSVFDIDDMHQVSNKFLIIDVYTNYSSPNYHYAYVYDLDNRLLLYKTALDGCTIKISKYLWVLRTEDDLIVQIY